MVEQSIFFFSSSSSSSRRSLFSKITKKNGKRAEKGSISIESHNK